MATDDENKKFHNFFNALSKSAENMFEPSQYKLRATAELGASLEIKDAHQYLGLHFTQAVWRAEQGNLVHVAVALYYQIVFINTYGFVGVNLRAAFITSASVNLHKNLIF